MSEVALRTGGQRRGARLLAYEIPGQITTLNGFRALHAALPLAGLRSSGKGANRTILDCVFRRLGPEQAVFLPQRGPRASAASPGRSHQGCQGRFHRPQMRKGLKS
jgi:hypothetical protein